MALIEINHVSLGYEGNRVIDNIDFKVQSGEYLCIVGENGVGKSTLIKGLLGLKKPSSGKIVFGEGLKAYEIGYLPQQTNAQKDFPASIYEVVLSGRLNSLGFKPFYSRADRNAAIENMRLMGIDHMKNKSYQELSGGQQQRVLLARALCATKKVILLDEPVAGLDPLVTKDLYETIKNINSQLNITVIMVSHDIHAAIKYSSHILQLSKKGAYYGTTDEYVNSQVGKLFIGSHEEGGEL